MGGGFGVQLCPAAVQAWLQGALPCQPALSAPHQQIRHRVLFILPTRNKGLPAATSGVCRHTVQGAPLPSPPASSIARTTYKLPFTLLVGVAAHWLDRLVLRV